MTRSRLGNGQRADHLVEALWRQALDAEAVAGDRDDPAVADAFVAWLRGGASRGGRRGVNRYLHAAYETRPDLQAAYPDLDGAGGPALIRWAWERGRRELIGELLPPHPSGSSRFAAGLGVEVFGFLGEALGLGEAARLYVRALEAARLPVSTRALRPDQATAVRRSGSHDADDRRAAEAPAFELLCMNPDSSSALVAAGALQVPPGTHGDRTVGVGDGCATAELGQRRRPGGRGLGPLALRRREPRSAGARARGGRAVARF